MATVATATNRTGHSSGQRSESPAHSSRSVHSVEHHRFGLARLKLKLGMSAEALEIPPAILTSPSLAPTRPPPTSLRSPQATPKRQRNVMSRLQALFPASSPSTPRTPADPPVLPAPNIPTLDITHDVETALRNVGKPKQRPFLKVKIVTWNHGYTLPKGDLSMLLGNVPLYEPPPDGPPSELPHFEEGDDHPYHIVVVAAQECPSQSKMPLGIGPGLKTRFSVRDDDKERRLEKEKERLEKEQARLEKRRSKQSGKLKIDADKDKEFVVGPQSAALSDPPGTPQPSKDFLLSPSAPPSPTLPPSFPYQQLPAPSAYSLKSLVSQSKQSTGEHHHVGWSAVLEDWFCNGVGAVSGVKPALSSDISLPVSMPINQEGTSPPKGISSSLSTQGDLDLASPVRTPSPENHREAHAPWLVPPPLGLDNPTPAAPIVAVPHEQRGPYVLLAKERLMAIALYVFVHRDVQHLVEGTSKSTVTAGLIGGRVGNKGGVGISMKVSGTTLLFVNAHLAAHEDKQAERVANMNKIKGELDLETFLAPDDPRNVAEDLTDRFDHAFIFGDLNFRLNVTRLHAEWLISRKDYATALSFDQLKQVLRDGDTFNGFTEAQIDFAPTFKYDVLRTLKKHKSVRRALKVKGLKRLGRKSEGGDEAEDDSTSESSTSSDEDEDDRASLASSAHRSHHSRHVTEEEEDSDAHDFTSPAARNTIANASLPKSDVHLVAMKAKERFLSLVQRPPSPAPSHPSSIPPLESAPVAGKRPKSGSDALKPPNSPLVPPAPLLQSAQSSLEVPRSSAELPRPPMLRRAQSTKSGGAIKGLAELTDAECAGVYDSSSKQRVPSWCDRILFKSNVPPEIETERPTLISNHRLSRIIPNFIRSRKDSSHSGGTSSDSPASLTPRAQEALGKSELSTTTTATQVAQDSPSRPSPLNRFFRHETLPVPTLSPASPKYDRSPSLNVLHQHSDPFQASPINETGKDSRRRSFSTSVVTLSSEPTREASVTPRPTSPDNNERASHGFGGGIPGFRWLFPRAPPTPPDTSQQGPTIELPPLHQKGEIVCNRYDTLSDRQMRQLEARSDHRPVMGHFSIYL